MTKFLQTFRLASILLIQQHICWRSATASFIRLKDIESFDYDAASDLLIEEEMPGSSRTSANKLPSFGDSTSMNCYAKVAKDFGFDFDNWKEDILSEAGVGVEELVTARRTHDFEDFQGTTIFLDFMAAFNSNVPLEALESLQAATTVCNYDDSSSAMNNPRAPSSEGTVVYMGLHIEAGFVADVAMSIFWALGDNNAPTAFIRGTFGAELGAGAEISGLLGFAFSGTTSDIIGDAVAVDADVLVGPVLGIAVIANINGLVSLEFTLGLGVGGGFLGVSYAITAELNPNPTPSPVTSPANPTQFPSASPSVNPTQFPSASPSVGLPGACAAPAPLGCPAGTGTGAAQSPVSSLSADGAADAVTLSPTPLAATDVTITFCVQGDVDSTSEFYNILDEDGNFIVQNCGEFGGGVCATVFGEPLTVTAAIFNAWAADDSVTFTFAASGTQVQTSVCSGHNLRSFVLSYDTV